jgi:hypothetical protein
MGTATRQLDTITSILREEDLLMPRKYQSGKLLVRKDVARPYYFVQENLGFKDETTRDEALRRRAGTVEGPKQ